MNEFQRFLLFIPIQPEYKNKWMFPILDLQFQSYFLC